MTRWSDGTPVTAADFVYSWQRLVDPKTTSPFAWFAALAGIANAQNIIDGKAAPETLGYRRRCLHPAGCSWINHCRGSAT